MQSDASIPNEIAANLEDVLSPQLKPKPNELQTHVGVTDYGAAVVFSSSCFDNDSNGDPDFLRQSMAWDIKSVKSVIPGVDRGVKDWAESMQKK